MIISIGYVIVEQRRQIMLTDTISITNLKTEKLFYYLENKYKIKNELYL